MSAVDTIKHLLASPLMSNHHAGLREALAVLETAAPPAAARVQLEDNEQYRMQMAGISTAALGYWKKGDAIHPDCDTPALRDVAKLYAEYDALYKAAAARVPLSEAASEVVRIFEGARYLLEPWTLADAIAKLKAAAQEGGAA